MPPISPIPATARRWTEAALAVALLAVPLYFAVFTSRVFEGDKAALLRWLGLGALVAAALSLWNGRRSDRRDLDRAAARPPDQERGPTRGEDSLPDPSQGEDPVPHRSQSEDPISDPGQVGDAVPGSGPDKHPLPSWLAASSPAPWVRRLIWALALCLTAELLATVFSVAPWTSLLGSQTRGQGLATALAVAVLAAGAASMAARPNGEARLASILGLSALPAGLYALAQSMGLDPLPWEGDVVTRVVGPAGASPMLAAHLVLALPFAVLMAATAWRSARREPGWTAATRLAAWLATVGAGGAALLLSASRGPLLGLAAGLWLLVLTAAGGLADPRRRRALALTALAAVFLGMAFLTGLNRGAFPALARLPLLNRLATALDPERNSTRARMRLWEGSMLALGDLAGRPDSDPPSRALPPRWRALVGYGPETMDLSWAPYYPPLLAYDEPRGYMPDRAHSLLLDAVLTGGLLGALAQLALLVLGIAAAWRLAAGARARNPVILPTPSATPLDKGDSRLGRVAELTPAASRSPSPATYRILGTATLGLALLAPLVLLLDGDWCLARSPWPAGACLLAPALGLNLVLGFGLGLAIVAWRSVAGRVAGTAGSPGTATKIGLQAQSWAWTEGLQASRGFGAAALVALTAHAVELQVSFATVASRLGAWAIVGGLIGIGLRQGRGDRRPAGTGVALSAAPPTAATPQDVGLPSTGFGENGQALLATGTIGVTLAFSLARPGQVAGGPLVAAALIALSAGGAWLALRPAALRPAALRPAERRPAEPKPAEPRPAAGQTTAGQMTAGRLALAVVLFTGLQVTLLDQLAAGPADAVGAAGASMALYVLALATVITLAARDTDVPRDSGARATTTARRLALALPTALLLAVPCLAPTLADAWYKEGERGWQAPVSALRADGKGGKAESYLQRAVDRYVKAQDLTPWEPAYALARARAHVEYADLLDARRRQAEGRKSADAGEASEGATVAPANDATSEDSAPADPAAAARWQAARDAQMALALAAVDRAEALAPGSPTPLLTRARALRVWGLATTQEPRRTERLDAALKAYASAAARVPGWPELLDEAAQTALAANHPQEALDLALEVVLKRDAFFRRAWRTAALAYEVLGDPERASAAYAAYFVDWRNASDVEALRGQVRALSAAGHPRTALERARRAVQLAPGEAAAHADLATLLEATGDRVAARQSAAAALAISPDDPGIQALAERVGVGSGR